VAEAKGCGEEICECAALVDRLAGSSDTGEEHSDEGGVRGELEQGLTAGAAGHGSGVVEVGDGNCREADCGAELRDSGGDRGLFGAGGETEAGVLYVAAGNDGAGMRRREKDGGADAEAAVGGVGVFSDSDGPGAEGIVREGRSCRGVHAEIEATRRAVVEQARQSRRRGNGLAR